MSEVATAHDVPAELAKPLSDAERAEIERFIHVLAYEAHSGAEHRAVGYLRRIYSRLLVIDPTPPKDHP